MEGQWLGEDVKSGGVGEYSERRGEHQSLREFTPVPRLPRDSRCGCIVWPDMSAWHVGVWVAGVAHTRVPRCVLEVSEETSMVGEGRLIARITLPCPGHLARARTPP